MWYSIIRAGLGGDGALVAKVSTDKDSPWFDGHFPGDPVLPGIAQLSMVTESMEKALDKRLVLHSLTRIKFRQLIRPGDVLDIHAAAGTKENQYFFRILNKEKEVCSGRLVLVPQQE